MQRSSRGQSAGNPASFPSMFIDRIPVPRTTTHRAPPTSSVSDRAGFSLLEVMIAVAVLALAITTAITTMQRAFLALDFARKVTLAGQIMQSEFEKIRLMDWKTLTDPARPATQDITATALAGFTNAITNTFTVTETVGDVHANMKQITVTTTWKGYDGRVFTRTYMTYYGKDGLYDYIYNSY